MRVATVALVAALVLAPHALAGGVRVHVTGGGTISRYPGGTQPCRSDSPMDGSACLYDDGNTGGGLVLMETPDPGWTFAGWPYPGCFPLPGGYCQTQGPQNACCSDLTVAFNRISVALGVTLRGAGAGTVDSAPGGIDCGSTCSAVYDWGTTVALTARPAVGSSFAGWSGACSGTGSCTVTLQSAASIAATFDVAAVAVSVAKTGSGGGTVTSASPEISCGALCSASFPFGSTVQLGASAATGSYFVSWGGACSGSGGDCTIGVGAAPVSVTARFDAITVTTRARGRTLSLALYVPRPSTLAVSLRGPARYSLTIPLRVGRNRPRLALPERLRPGTYTVHFLLRDAQGAAPLAPTTISL